MALPFSFSNVVFPTRTYYLGPWKAPNGSIYVVLLDSGDQSIEIHKCEDYDFPATTAFSEQNAAGAPTIVATDGGNDTVWGYMSGTDIHVVNWYDDGSDSYYYYHRFSTASDTWSSIDNQIDTWDDKYEPPDPGVSFVYRENDGGQDEYIVLVNGATEKIGGSNYRRVDYYRSTNGTSWTGPTAVDNGGETNYSECVAIRGSVPDANGHVVHFAWHRPSTQYILVRTLRYSSGWQLSTEFQTVSLISATQRSFLRGIFNSFSEQVGILFRDDTTAEPMLLRITEDSNGDLDSATDAEYSISANDIREVTEHPVGCLAIDPISNKAYVMWGEDTDSDLFRHESAAGWSTWTGDGTEEEAGTCNGVSCNVYPRNGSLKLAFLWDDGGTIKYDEYDIGQETAPAWIDALPPAHNYKIGPFSV
jgi:hypothetical protein